MDEWKPKHRVHLGDVWDFRALRNGASPEERAEGISYDINCGLEFREWYKPQLLTMGNHDYRLWRQAEQHSQGVLADLCRMKANDLEDDIRKLKIQWVPWGVENYLTLPMGGPKLIHGYRSTMYPAKAHHENWGDCILAHVHKPDKYEARNIDGGKAFSVGTMADIKKMTYANNYPAKLGWRNSFLYGMHNTKTGAWQAWPVTKDKNTDNWMSPMGVITP